MEKELTYREWFEKNLPEDVAKKAIDYTPPELIDTKKYSTGYPLLHAFNWEDTVEGFDFWNKWDEKTKYL